MLEDCSPWLAVACIGPADDWNFGCDEFPCASLTVAEPAEDIRKSLLVTILGYGLPCTLTCIDLSNQTETIRTPKAKQCREPQPNPKDHHTFDVASVPL